MSGILTPEFVSSVNIANNLLLNRRPQVPRPVDALLFGGRSHGDHTGLFELARNMLEIEIVNFIALPNNEGIRVGGTTPNEAGPGITEVKKILLEQYQTPADKIVPTPLIEVYHTRTENDAFIEISRRMGWKSAVLLTQPHQLLRAMLGMVRVMDETGYKMEIYTASPLNTPWQEVVKGSQGLKEMTREEHIMEEVKRIPVYQEKGDLASFEELFAYLETRDRGSLRLTH